MNITKPTSGNRANEGSCKREKSGSFETNICEGSLTYSTSLGDSGKRRKSNDGAEDNCISATPPRSQQNVTSARPSSPPRQDTSSCENNVISREDNAAATPVSELPDPNAADIAPDEFLLKLVKAQYGLSLTHKGAKSLDNFFQEVSEEQRAAYTMRIVTAVRKNNLDELKKIQAEDGQRIDCYNQFGESLLHMACRRGFEDIVDYLMDQPEISVRISDDNGRTPMHDCCWNPNPQLKISKRIIERDPTLFLISDNRGYTPFQYARPQHWPIWRKFLFDNRDCLRALTETGNVSRLLEQKGEN